MKIKFYIVILTALCLSCGKDKVVLLPEINTAKITEVNDVSSAYLFYDETQPDSLELNRKNLISTTNWLVNVDKRLTLEQAIPKIKFLQDKKRNAEMHKNENAKNYYSCNDTSIKNLGFIEFTDVVYWEGSSVGIQKKTSQLPKDNTIAINLKLGLDKKIHITNTNDELSIKTIHYSEFENHLTNLKHQFPNKAISIKLNFDEKLSFQDYITFKSLVSNIKLDSITIDNNEFIY
jgi:hypothetical protein